MRFEGRRETGGADRHSQLQPKLSSQSQHQDNSRHYRKTQEVAHSGKLQRLVRQAAETARAEALKDAKRALLAYEPGEVAELRQSAATLFALAKSLQGGLV